MTRTSSAGLSDPEAVRQAGASSVVDEVVQLLEAAAAAHERAGRHALASSHLVRARHLTRDARS